MERLTVKQLDGSYHIYDTRVIQQTTCYDENNRNAFDLYEGTAINKLGYYEDADEQGLLLMLPCKIGDPVYFVIRTGEYCVSWWEIEERKFTFEIYENLRNGRYTNANWGYIYFNKEHAEKALERIQNGKNL